MYLTGSLLMTDTISAGSNNISGRVQHGNAPDSHASKQVSPFAISPGGTLSEGMTTEDKLKSTKSPLDIAIGETNEAQFSRTGFKTEDDAARSALQEAWGYTQSDNNEWGGLIYVDAETLKYGYTAPVTSGSPHSVDLSGVEVPNGKFAQGRYHTHPPDDGTCCDNWFGPNDIPNAKNEGQDAYIGYQGGITKWSYDTGKEAVIGNLPE
jgi:hypothetical protein